MITNETPNQPEALAVSDNYLADLLRYYEEEIEGESLFARLSEFFLNEDHKLKMNAFVALEIQTNRSIKPLIDFYGLRPRDRSQLLNTGISEANAMAGLTWLELMTLMVEEYPVFVDEFIATMKITPEKDRVLMQLLLDHEVAMIEFARLELDGDVDNSLSVITNHMQNYDRI
jgi:dimethylamine/trimethylamine dehydrogenase